MRQHGTRSAYNHGINPGERGCRCDACCEANRAYERMRSKRDIRIRKGQAAPRFVDAGEARRHLLWLHDQGVGARTVASILGCNVKTVQEIRDGVTRRTRPNRAAAILAVGTHRRPEGSLVDAAATWERIDELVARGWTRGELAVLLGSTSKTPALQLGRDKVTEGNARKVRDLYDRLMADVVAQREQVRDRQRAHRARSAA